MRRVNNKPWIIATVFVSLVILAVGYFFGMQPRLDEAEETNEMAEEQENMNDILQIKVNQLAADFAKLDEYRAEIATYEVGIPASADLSELIVATDDLAEEAGVLVTHSSSTDPMPISVPEEAKSVFDVEGLVTMPLELEVFGAYEDVAAYVQALQVDLSRHFLVRGLQLDADVSEDVNFSDREYSFRITGDLFAIVKGGSVDDTPPSFAVPGFEPEPADEPADDSENADADSDEDLLSDD